MKYSRIFKVGIIAVLALGLIVGAFSASAYATVDSYVATCSSLQASGTTDAPYVMLYAYNYETEAEYIVAYPVSGGMFDLAFNFPAQPAGSEMNYEVWGSPNDDTANYGWDNEDYFNIDLYCQPATGDSAPPLPSDYVLMNIICDTAVYDTPAGSPVGDGRLLAGQTFYVDPVSVTGSDGNEWTQVFVSSYTNPYIRTSCIN